MSYECERLYSAKYVTRPFLFYWPGWSLECHYVIHEPSHITLRRITCSHNQYTNQYTIHLSVINPYHPFISYLGIRELLFCLKATSNSGFCWNDILCIEYWAFLSSDVLLTTMVRIRRWVSPTQILKPLIGLKMMATIISMVLLFFWAPFYNITCYYQSSILLQIWFLLVTQKARTY